MGKENTPCLKYKQIEFYGVSLKSEMKPYKSVVNNGYTIWTQDEGLLRDLEMNENYGNGIIDWFLFKKGKTVLISSVGKIYGCTNFLYNSLVELTEFKEDFDLDGLF